MAKVQLLPVLRRTTFSGISHLAQLDEVPAAAVRAEDMLEVEGLRLGHYLAQVVVGAKG